MTIEDKLRKLMEDFIKRHEISCAECIHQSDEPQIEATSLIESMCDIVGYHVFEED